LDCRRVGDELIVREWLAQQKRAKGAIGSTVGMLAISGGMLYGQWAKTPMGMLIFVLAIIAAALALIPAVIQQSWRETLLRLGDGTLRLSMGGPLARREDFWRYG